MLPSIVTRVGLVQRLAPCLTNMVCNLHISPVQSARRSNVHRQSNNTINETSQSTSSSVASPVSQSNAPLETKAESQDSTEKVESSNDEPWKNNEPGLMEFFDDKENWGEKVVRVGRSWKKEELRIKSNEDLHKLWFVLLKERNMLLTMQEDYENEGHRFPSPERIEKIEDSMENLEAVVRERNRAYFQLEVGEDATAERAMAFRQDQFGRWTWQRLNEHYKPYLVSKNWRTVFGPGYGKDVNSFIRAWRERQRNKEYSLLMRQHTTVRQLLRRFPNLDLDYLQRKYPKVPVDYYKNNLNFEPEYKPFVSKGAYQECH